MKKTLLLITALCHSACLQASMYVGIEAGAASISSDEFKTTFTADKKTLNPTGSTTNFGGFLGYKFTPNLAIELGFNQFDKDDDTEQNMGLVTRGSNQYTKERQWDSNLTAKQFTLSGAYFHNFSENLQLKGLLGLSSTQYKYTSSSKDELELVINDDIEIYDYRPGGETKSEDEVGFMLGVGLEYMVYKGLSLGANVKYQSDSMSQNTFGNAVIAYYF